MGRRAEGGPDRSAGIYVAVISALIAGGYANFDPWRPVTYIDATARSSAGPVAVSDVVTSPIPIEVQHRIGEALAAHTEVLRRRSSVGDPARQPGSGSRCSCHAGPNTARWRPSEAAGRLGRPARAAAWADLLTSAAQLAPVLVHGDIHEDQILADGDRLTGIIDWETARVDHPFWDFDLGEWGTGPWRRRRRDFSALWARGWRAYAQARGLETGSRPLETAFRLRHALGLFTDPGDPAVVGTIQE